VIRGLPNDHYHAFADPMVFVLIGIGAAALWRTVPREAPRAASPGRLIAVAGVGALVAWAATHVPPPAHPDGGFPAAALAAERIEAVAGPGPIDLRSLPVFKSIEAYAYPLILGGRTLRPGDEISEATLVREDATGSEPQTMIVICDSLFEPVLGAPCGGLAEAAIVPTGNAVLLERFDAAPGRVVSVFRAESP
jgi:hypothetical protein